MCVCVWVDARDRASETARMHMHVTVFMCVCLHMNLCVCVCYDCYCYANLSVWCQTRFQILSLAFLRRNRAKHNKQQSNKTTQHRPQAHLSLSFISQHSQTLLYVNMRSGPSRWEELGQKTREEILPQCVNQSKSCLFSTFVVDIWK